jgi:hypothetical protein
MPNPFSSEKQRKAEPKSLIPKTQREADYKQVWYTGSELDKKSHPTVPEHKMIHHSHIQSHVEIPNEKEQQKLNNLIHQYNYFIPIQPSKNQSPDNNTYTVISPKKWYHKLLPRSISSAPRVSPRRRRSKKQKSRKSTRLLKKSAQFRHRHHIKEKKKW